MKDRTQSKADVPPQFATPLVAEMLRDPGIVPLSDCFFTGDPGVDYILRETALFDRRSEFPTLQEIRLKFRSGDRVEAAGDFCEWVFSPAARALKLVGIG